jgi:ribosome-associated protein
MNRSNPRPQHAIVQHDLEDDELDAAADAAQDELEAAADPALSDAPESEPDRPERPSKTQRKNAMHELQAIGKRLMELSSSQAASAPIDDDLRAAIDEGRRITKHEARRRQLQYIGKRMRDVDPVPIRQWLARLDGLSLEATRELHTAERWRERLLADDAALTEFARGRPGLDLQALRTVIREARKEFAERAAAAARGDIRAPKHFRELFRIVRAALETPNEEDTE